MGKVEGKREERDGERKGEGVEGWGKGRKEREVEMGELEEGQVGG